MSQKQYYTVDLPVVVTFFRLLALCMHSVLTTCPLWRCCRARAGQRTDHSEQQPQDQKLRLPPKKNPNPHTYISTLSSRFSFWTD